MRTPLVLIAVTAGLCSFHGRATAQIYPTRPITIVVPYVAGGPTDATARLLADHMAKSLGKPVVIENVGGGSGALGVGRVVRAPADGYTLSLGQWGTHVLLGATNPVPFDLLKDLKPVALISQSPQILVSKASVAARNLIELVQWIKDNEPKVTQGTTGAGSAPHVAGVLFQNLSGTRYQFVPYRGGAPAMQDLVAGHIDLMITPAGNALAQIRDGKIKAYAVTAAKRMTAAPEIATVDEAGLPGFHISIWQAIWAPAGTPDEVVAKLNSAIAAALVDPMIRAKLERDLGQEIPSADEQTPEALGAHHKAEIEKWWPIIKAVNVKAD